MYFPYMYVKRHELLALRALSKKIAIKRKIFPILEPVNKSLGDLARALKVLKKDGNATVVIVNPNLIEYKGSAGNFDLVQSSIDLLGYLNDKVLIPAFKIVDSTTLAEVQVFLNKYLNFAPVLIHTSAHLPLGGGGVNFNVLNVFIDGTVPANYISSFPGSKVIIKDGFVAASTNATFPPSNYYYDLNVNYLSQGFVGFGDYTITGRNIKAGGGPAYAVAIHLSYEDPVLAHSGIAPIYINHFLSRTITNPPNDNALKIGEALPALQNFIMKYPGIRGGAPRFSFSNAAAVYMKLNPKTTLGKIKEYSIQHHIEVMENQL
ncbi:sce7725 family protein [Chromobacterium sphagni]|uniref:sce7725 family protein n=1 Tax=Chromobacterium sphagni TaxID=1903179 RepID=UPI00111397DB|nr:sce7725 family protein [Chromobacterium sphagni]